MITAEQIAQAITETPELVSQIIPTIENTDAFKNILDNKANSLYQSKIGEEVKNIHSQYDNQFKSILNELPGTNPDGTRQKTYDFLGAKLQDYKKLLEQKETLNKDEQVKALKDQIEALKNGGAGEEYKNLYNQAVKSAQEEKAELLKKLQDKDKGLTDYKKSMAIKSAISQLKINPDVDKTLRELAISQAEAELMKLATFQGDKLVFTNPLKEGEIIMGKDYTPISPAEMLTNVDSIKSIILKEGGAQKGGGANPTVHGRIDVTSVEGKGTQEKLVLPAGAWTTQVEFTKIAEEALARLGVTKSDMKFNKLKDQAFKEYEVTKLPLK